MKKFNGPIEKAADWLRGTDEGEKRWWLVLKILAGAAGVAALVYVQVIPHIKL